MGGVQWPHVAHVYIAEVCRAGQEEVGGPALVCGLVVVLVTGTARQEEPALQTLAPSCRLVDEVACRAVGLLLSDKTQKPLHMKNLASMPPIASVCVDDNPMVFSTWWSDPCRCPQAVVVGHPVLVLHISVVANNLHPLWVVVDDLTRGCGPLLPQATDIQLLILHCQPLCLKPCT